MAHSDLFDLLAKDGPMSQRSVAHIIRQLVEAIAVCNQFGIAHRDVKLSNITFKPFAGPPAIVSQLTEQHMAEARNGVMHHLRTKHELSERLLDVKLADFGMAGFTDSNHMLSGRCGTPGYVAPDIFQAAKSGSYHMNVDMFSVSDDCDVVLCCC